MRQICSKPFAGARLRCRAFCLIFATLWSVAGCQGPDQKNLEIGDQRNWQLYEQTARTIPIAEPSLPPLALVVTNSEPLPERKISLQEALAIAMSQPDVNRIASGDDVVAATTTFYDIQASDARLQAALTAFDATLDSKMYTNEFENPPNAFFGPGLAQPQNRDEAAVTFGLSKPLRRGGLLSTNYNPEPGYFFLPGSTTSGFNPTYASEWQLSLKQPLLRNFGLDVNIAPIQVSQLEAEQSAWEFKKSLMSSIRSIVETYWELHATEVSLKEYEKVVPVLEEIVRIQQESLRAKLVISADVARAQAKLHEYKQEQIDVQTQWVTTELRLRNLLQLPPTDGSTLTTLTPPTANKIRLDTQRSYLLAVDNQPDIVKKRLDICIRRLELVVKANQKRPDLDFTALYRMNGLGDNLGDAWDQMTSADFTDVELGVTFSMPVGLRRGKAEYQEARYRLARDNRLLEQETFSVLHQLNEASRKTELAYKEYEQAKLQLQYATEWAKGAKLRYENPEPESSTTNWIVEYLNDYYLAIRSRTDATIAVAETLNRYNFELVRFEEVKGTLLEFFAIDYVTDPCRQASRLPSLAVPTGQGVAGERPIERVGEAVLLEPVPGLTPAQTNASTQPAIADASFQQFIESLNR